MLVDFTALLFSVEVLGIWYGLGVFIGAIAGAVTNFLINRHWSFQAADKAATPQAFKYTLVSLGSLVLNVGGVVLLTETLAIRYWISKAIVTVSVGVFFNFTMYRVFVFK